MSPSATCPVTATGSDRSGPTTPTSCQVCAGRCHAGFALCYCCAALTRQLRLPLVPVVAVARYQLGDRMHRRLRGYKDSPVDEVRRRHTERLVEVTDTWLTDHRARLCRQFGRDWQVVATVPSSCRPHSAPVEPVVLGVPALAGLYRPLLIRGPEATGHLRASRHGFALRPGTEPDRLRHTPVLVVDDTLTTGARAQSAAATLRLRGIPVVGVLVLGRVVRPSGQSSCVPRTPAPE